MTRRHPDVVVEAPPEPPPDVIAQWQRELDDERDQRVITRYSAYRDSGQLVRDHRALVHEQQLARVAASRLVVVRRPTCARSREQRARSTRRTSSVASSDDGPPAPEPPPKRALNLGGKALPCEAIFPSVEQNVATSGVVA